MFWKRRKKPRSFRVGRLHFIGEQVGAVEQDLMSSLGRELNGHPNVTRAYLARVSYGGSLPVVALCLRAEKEDESLVRVIGALFASIFSRDEHLDVLFLNENQESELARVCAPFFDSRG